MGKKENIDWLIDRKGEMIRKEEPSMIIKYSLKEQLKVITKVNAR